MKKNIFCLTALYCLLTVYVSAQDSVININKDIQLIHITDSVYMHKSWYEFQFGRYPSNGLVYIKNGKAILIDTPVTNEQTEQLCEFLKSAMHIDVVKFIAGHYHIDCMGGIDYIHGKNIHSVGNILTKNICIEKNLPVPEQVFEEELKFMFEEDSVICRYFGGGHTIDNIVVFFPDKKILFGGCLIKSGNSKNLGNTEEAIVTEWDKTVLKIMDAYKDIDYVIPGHGDFGGYELLSHTVTMVEEFRKKEGL